MNLLNYAQHLRQLNIPCFPVYLGEKAPGLTPKGPDARALHSGKWGAYRDRLPTERELRAWFESPPDNRGIGIVLGNLSGLACLDFDRPDGFEILSKVGDPSFDELREGYVERTARGKYHVLCRPGTMFQKRDMRCGAKFIDEDGGHKEALEFLGEGAYIVAAPSPGYEALRPIESAAEANLEALKGILRLGRAVLHDPRIPAEESCQIEKSHQTPQGRPGDVFDETGDALPIMLENGWTVAQSVGESKLLRRPGKKEGWSASYNRHGRRGVFVWSSSVPEFEPDRWYSPFQVFALYEHGGDFTAAARAVARPDMSNVIELVQDAPEPEQAIPDAPIPKSGLLKEWVEWVEGRGAAFHDPQPSLALGAGLAFFSYATAGRKALRAEGSHYTNDSNLYAVLVSKSGSGKGTADKALHRAVEACFGDMSGLANNVASGEAIFRTYQDYGKPSMLFSLDEFGTLMKNASNPNSPQATLFRELLTLYNAPPAYRKSYASKNPIEIDFKMLPTILGATTPSEFQQYLDERSVKAGLVNRFLFFFGRDVPRRGIRFDAARPADVPYAIVERVRGWVRGSEDTFSGRPRLLSVNLPKALQARVVEATQTIVDATAGGEYEALHARTNETFGRLLLVVAACNRETVVDSDDIDYCYDLVMHQVQSLEAPVRNMVEFDGSEFGELCRRTADYLRSSPRGSSLRDIYRGGPLRGKKRAVREAVIESLEDDGIVVSSEKKAKNGKLVRVYTVAQ